jgi:hypothetical protein
MRLNVIVLPATVKSDIALGEPPNVDIPTDSIESALAVLAPRVATNASTTTVAFIRSSVPSFEKTLGSIPGRRGAAHHELQLLSHLVQAQPFRTFSASGAGAAVIEFRVFQTTE